MKSKNTVFYMTLSITFSLLLVGGCKARNSNVSKVQAVQINPDGTVTKQRTDDIAEIFVTDSIDSVSIPGIGAVSAEERRGTKSGYLFLHFRLRTQDTKTRPKIKSNWRSLWLSTYEDPNDRVVVEKEKFESFYFYLRDNKETWITFGDMVGIPNPTGKKWFAGEIGDRSINQTSKRPEVNFSKLEVESFQYSPDKAIMIDDQNVLSMVGLGGVEINALKSISIKQDGAIKIFKFEIAELCQGAVSNQGLVEKTSAKSIEICKESFNGRRNDAGYRMYKLGSLSYRKGDLVSKETDCTLNSHEDSGLTVDTHVSAGTVFKLRQSTETPIERRIRLYYGPNDSTMWSSARDKSPYVFLEKADNTRKLSQVIVDVNFKIEAVENFPPSFIYCPIIFDLSSETRTRENQFKELKSFLEAGPNMELFKQMFIGKQ
jgi:hypothetical protein